MSSSEKHYGPSSKRLFSLPLSTFSLMSSFPIKPSPHPHILHHTTLLPKDQDLHQLTEELDEMKLQLAVVHEDRASAEREKQGLKQLLQQKEARQWTVHICFNLLLLCRNWLRSVLQGRGSWNIFISSTRPTLMHLRRRYVI